MKLEWKGRDFTIVADPVEDLVHCEVCLLGQPASHFVKAGQVKDVVRCRTCRIDARSNKDARKILIASLKDKPCHDCRQAFHPCVMEFDHRDPSTKLFSLSDGYKYPESEILLEADKCDVVCSNCHRVRTWSRTQD